MTSRTQVPLLDLKLQYQPLAEQLQAAMARVCASQAFILGPAVKELESAIAAYSQCRFGIGVSSGTDALLIALMALDIGAGDAVITSPFTFFATAGTIARTGAVPLFCDIDPATFNLAPDGVRTFLQTRCESRGGDLFTAAGQRVRAIMPVHLYGQMADMAALMEIAQAHNLRVIEDAAQAIGAQDARGRRACSYGDVGCLSFFPTKNLGAFGDAGMCVANDPALADRLEILRVHGGKPKYFHAVIGGNFRIDELQAAVLNVKLKHLDAWTAGRRRNAAFYDQAFAQADLGRAVHTPAPAAAGARHIYNQYVIRARDRDLLRQHLNANGVGTEIYYPVPLHLQKCFAYLKHRAGDFPLSERAAEETLALPIYPELTQTQLQYVVDTIAGFYSRG
ncbi:MAG TPA: DegT/DnrJ/EryC1/StrS family aminotransferase [Steroidobacteraceae bacterium]|nr:DegT/DnrJ/EryC1/StrS family aminotransferase [Steroidobacteraceae bacterium]